MSLILMRSKNSPLPRETGRFGPSAVGPGRGFQPYPLQGQHHGLLRLSRGLGSIEPLKRPPYILPLST